MVRVLMASALVALTTAVAIAGTNPQVAALRQQIKALRAQEKTVTAALKQQYQSLVNNGHLSEAQIENLRIAFRRQKNELLGLATTDSQRNSIQQQYDVLKNALNNGTNIDATVIHQLRKQESVQRKLVHALYVAQIKQLEAQIRQISASTSGRGR